MMQQIREEKKKSTPVNTLKLKSHSRWGCTQLNTNTWCLMGICPSLPDAIVGKFGCLGMLAVSVVGIMYVLMLFLMVVRLGVEIVPLGMCTCASGLCFLLPATTGC
uniref:Uncharacterized protein n=1 Tax=Eutreptiella gymnastica TaxID=73025 RepID=A0A7S4GJ58_9EUGL